VRNRKGDNVTNIEFKEALEAVGYKPKRYSGRGMYGRECIAINDADPWEIATELAQNYPDATFPKPSEDSLGRGSVIYWPSMAWPAEVADSEESDIEQERRTR
jgi:hypothetical protein